MIIKKCLICNATFSVKNYRKHTASYCSRKCMWKGQIGININARKGKYVICKLCKKSFYAHPSRLKGLHKRKYCSKECRIEASNGRVSWNKGIKYFEVTGKNNGNWLGDKAGYHAMHKWVYRQKGKPTICKHCNITSQDKQLYWANKKHDYKRNINDYIALCASCHRKYDLKNNPKKKT